MVISISFVTLGSYSMERFIAVVIVICISVATLDIFYGCCLSRRSTVSLDDSGNGFCTTFHDWPYLTSGQQPFCCLPHSFLINKVSRKYLFDTKLWCHYLYNLDDLIWDPFTPFWASFLAWRVYFQRIQALDELYSPWYGLTSWVWFAMPMKRTWCTCMSLVQWLVERGCYYCLHLRRLGLRYPLSTKFCIKNWSHRLSLLS